MPIVALNSMKIQLSMLLDRSAEDVLTGKVEKIAVKHFHEHIWVWGLKW